MKGDRQSLGMTALNSPSSTSSRATAWNSSRYESESVWRAVALDGSGFFRLDSKNGGLETMVWKVIAGR